MNGACGFVVFPQRQGTRAQRFCFPLRLRVFAVMYGNSPSFGASVEGISMVKFPHSCFGLLRECPTVGNIPAIGKQKGLPGAGNATTFLALPRLESCGLLDFGGMAEWLKARDSKSCGQQCLGSSNLPSSAISTRPQTPYSTGGLADNTEERVGRASSSGSSFLFCRLRNSLAKLR